MKNKKVKDISFHYTQEVMAKDLIALLKLPKNVSALDAGSGKNKVWFKNINVRKKYECEIEDGVDFFD